MKSRAISLPPLWAFVACYRANFRFMTQNYRTYKLINSSSDETVDMHMSIFDPEKTIPENELSVTGN